MYCVKCGVELADSEKSCPLCKTPVYFPDLPDNSERNYPEFVSVNERVSPRGVYFVLSFLFGIGAVISAMCDLMLNDEVLWGGYVVGALLLSYVTVLLPLWFRRRSPAIFAPVDFLVLLIYLYYINASLGGDWFFSFALPVTGGVAAIVLPSVIVGHYVRRGYLYIAGGALIASGGFALLLEWLLNVNFQLSDRIMWAYFPMTALVLFGIMLIVIAIVKPFRESLRKFFAI